MGIHPKLPTSPYEISPPETRWIPADRQTQRQLVGPFVRELRLRVQTFRNEGYQGATETSKSLLKHWFHTPHLIDGKDFQYYFAQREALETLVYLFDVLRPKNKIDLLHLDKGGNVAPALIKETWKRYVVKMATGSGKTKVLSLVIAWCFFHKLYEDNSPLARNFLLIAPNIIVLDRLYKDFQGLCIFRDDPVLPPNGFEGRDWQNDFHLDLHKQNEVSALKPLGNIFLTNIHRVYSHSITQPAFSDDNRKDYFFGKKPTKLDFKIDLRDIVRDISELVILNDEAHHIHDQQLAWYRSIEDIDNQLQQKNSRLALQLDVTATPKNNKGQIFIQTITDYPLVEAIHQGIVKHPVLPDKESQDKLKEQTTARYVEKYKDYIDLGVAEWRKSYVMHDKMGKKAILFVMTDDTKNCDEVAEYLEQHYPDLKDKVLVIHTNKSGDFNESASSKAGKKELEDLRKFANEIDDREKNLYRAVVSVMMLKEGWDVRNVTTIVGLRPFKAKSNILPEQTIGRGLRLMYANKKFGAKERVSVIGTEAFMKFVREVEAEGVQFEFANMSVDLSETPTSTLIIEIDKHDPELDISIPILSNSLYKDHQRLSQLDIDSINQTPIPYQLFDDQAKPRNIVFEHAITAEESHRTVLAPSDLTDCRSAITFFTEVVMKKLHLFADFSTLYPKMEEFVRRRLFGKHVSLESRNTILNLNQEPAKSIMIDSFVKAANSIIVQKISHPPKVEKTLHLLEAQSFPSSKQKYLLPKKSPFNKIVGDSDYELNFASFLEQALDVISYAKNYNSIDFALDYADHEGHIRTYRPDFLVKLDEHRVFIVETKGIADPDTLPKFSRLEQWCRDANKAETTSRFDCLYVPKQKFDSYQTSSLSFQELVNLCQSEKPASVKSP